MLFDVSAKREIATRTCPSVNEASARDRVSVVPSASLRTKNSIAFIVTSPRSPKHHPVSVRGSRRHHRCRVWSFHQPDAGNGRAGD